MRSVMKPHAILLHQAQDVSHPFAHHIHAVYITHR